MKSRCERCGSALDAGSEAYICSYECTFCFSCASTMHGTCGNCGGELVVRPRRKVLSAALALPAPTGRITERYWPIWVWSFAVWTALALVRGVTGYLFDASVGRPMSWSVELMVPLVNFLLYALLTPIIFWLSVRYPIQRDNWMRRGVQYGFAALVFSLVHVGVRGLLYPAWDLRSNAFAYAAWNPHTGVWKFDWFLYRGLLFYNSLDNILVGFIPVVLIAHAVVYHRRFREREFRASQLETQLAKARLQTLKSQLQPHFLFNTMHSISSLMLTDVPAADRMMTRLSDLLRMSLEKDGVQITPLSCELDFVNGYLEIEKIRFEDRLKVSVEVAPNALDAQVPHLILQPLVENAVKHGISRRSSGGEIGIAATYDERNLYLRVSDNGPGMNESSPEERGGLGLRATRERLQALYGDKQSIEIVEGPEGGVEVRVQIPFRTEVRPL